MKNLLIFLLILIVLAAVGFVLFKCLNPNSGEGDNTATPTSPKTAAERFFVEYHVYGGMENENLILRIFTHTDRSFETGEDITDTCIVPESAAEKLTAVFENCGAFNWGELPDKAYELADAPTTGIVVELPDKSFSVNDDKELPSEGKMIYKDVYNIMKSYIAWKSE